MRPSPGGRDVVATILAIGIATAINLIMVAVLWDALRSDTPGLSENATQVITALGSGIIGVLGGYIGGRAAEQAQHRAQEAAAPRDTSDTGSAAADRRGVAHTSDR